MDAPPDLRLGRRALAVACLSLLVACQKKPVETEYFPLDAGRAWTYTMRADGAGADDPTELLVSVVGEEDLGGQRVTRQKIEIAGETYFLFVGVDDRGVYRYATQGAGEAEPVLESQRDYYLTLPLTVGRSWKGEASPSFVDVDTRLGIESKVESTDETVRVAAGTFPGSVKIATSGAGRAEAGEGADGATLSISEANWYAPDVGLVKSVVEEVVEREGEERRVRVTTELASSRR